MPVFPYRISLQFLETTNHIPCAISKSKIWACGLYTHKKRAFSSPFLKSIFNS